MTASTALANAAILSAIERSLGVTDLRVEEAFDTPELAAVSTARNDRGATFSAYRVLWKVDGMQFMCYFTPPLEVVRRNFWPFVDETSRIDQEKLTDSVISKIRESVKNLDLWRAARDGRELGCVWIDDTMIAGQSG